VGRYRKILVAFDGSPSAANALRQALALPELERSAIAVLSVLPAYEGDLELVGVRDPEGAMRGQGEPLVRAVREIAGPDRGRVEASVEQGRPYERIVEAAREGGCDLVVMGRRGLRRLERMLMGSVTARVIVHSTKDVLVVPREAAVQLDDVVVATDGSAHGDAALEAAIGLAGPRGGTITAISVAEMYPELYADAPQLVERREGDAAATLERAARKAEAAGIRLQARVLRGDPADEVVSYAREHGAGTIFVGNRGRAGLERLILGSVAEKIIGLSHCPVYVAKPRRRAHLRAVEGARRE
jgi:nucleotide-binding universal stress UspA family protein